MLYDFIFTVDRLPEPGQVATILGDVEDPDAHRFPGGTAFNLAFGLGKLNEQVSVAHPVGYDFPGGAYERRLQEHSVGLEGLLIDTSCPSGYAYLFCAPDGATLCFSYPTKLSKRELSTSAFVSADIFILTPVPGPLHDQTIAYARQHTIPLAVCGIAEPAIWDLLPDLAVLSLNHHELRRLAAIGDAHTPDDVINQVPGVVYVTRGAAGCSVYEAGSHVGDVTAVSPQRVVDPSGAGDSFMAGALAGMRRGYTPLQAARIGATAASFVVEAYGCQTNVPTWPQIAERLYPHDRELADSIRHTDTL